jgi:hypothetical protein
LRFEAVFCHAAAMRRAQYSNVALVGTLLVPVLAQAAADPGATLRAYLSARWRGDVAAAEKLWDTEDWRRSQAMGTSYTGLEARFDDNLLWSAADRAAAQSWRPVPKDSTVEPSWARYTVVLQGAQPPDTLRYTLRRTADEWRVTSPYTKVAGSWTTREGRYFRLHAAKIKFVNRDALQTIDDGIQRMFDRLGTSDQARLRLERVKIEYFLCDTDAELRSLGVGPGDGTYRLAGERVATRAIADLNAVSRVVTHLTLKETPPTAAPVLEEGLAAALGGWGTSSAGVVLQQGTVLANPKGTDLESVLDPASKGKPEVMVPVAAVWSDALLRQLGPQKFLPLYRSLSRPAGTTGKPDAATVRREIEAATGKRGTALADWVRASSKEVRAPLAGGCDPLPQESRDMQPLVRWRDTAEEWALQGFVTGDDYTFIVAPYSGPTPKWAQQFMDSLAVARGEKPAPPTERQRPAGDPPQLAVLFRERLVREPEAYDSALFHKQFTRQIYAGELFGLLIEPDRVRLYDYRRDVLVGIHSPETTLPGQPPYYEEKPGRICFRMRRDLLPKFGEYVPVVMRYTGE